MVTLFIPKLTAICEGKLLSKRQRLGPAKVKMIETQENEIEEMTMSDKTLPAVHSPGDRRQAKSAFVPEKKDSFECGEVWDIPGSNCVSASPRYQELSRHQRQDKSYNCLIEFCKLVYSVLSILDNCSCKIGKTNNNIEEGPMQFTAQHSMEY